MTARFGVLGDVEAHLDGTPVPIGYAQLKCVLAVLLVEVNRTVSVDELIDRVWGARRLPKHPRGALQHCVTLLRRTMAGAREFTIAWRSSGYQLVSDPEMVDMHQFRALVGVARGAADDDRAEAALAQAMNLWRGEPFAGLDTPWLEGTRAALTQQRHTARLDLTDIQLRHGRHNSLLADLRDWAGRDPLDERLACQYLLALYRSGRQAQALEHYECLRRGLAEQVGADPSPGVQKLHRQILTADPALGGTATGVAGFAVPSSAPAPVACTLPADVADFVGRARELRGIAQQAACAAEAGRSGAVYTVDGMPGVGKTALAVHAGHLVSKRFPDRQLFLDLHGHTTGRRPTDPMEALGILLAADGLDPGHLPSTLDGRVALWRDRMSNRRALLILDNAAGSRQVAPLLPGTPGCLVLVTSRRHLADLPATATTVPLDILSPDEARRMFVNLASRAAGEPDRVDDLVTRCGRLPLAISLLARLFNRHRSWSMDDLLTETTANLLTVTAENHSVAAAFDLSYRRLSADQQRVLRRLGLHPGADIDPDAAAALTGLPRDEVIRHLDTLHGHHLVTEPAFRRYGMHGLIRQYARTLG